MVKHWYQKVKNARGQTITVLDLEAIRKEPVNPIFIISERGRQGKTMTAFQMIKQRWDDNRETAVFIFNTVKLFHDRKHKLIQQNLLVYPEMWENVIIRDSGMYEKIGKELLQFCHFVPLSTPHTFKVGTRPPKVTTIIYDEFNVSLRNLQGQKQFTNFETILFSCGDEPDLKAFIFGNNLTSNVPILTAMGVRAIDEEVQYIQYGRYSTALVYVPKTTKETREQLEKERNWRYDIARQGGSYEMSILNTANFDNNVGIVPLELQDGYKLFTKRQYWYFDINSYALVYQNSIGHYYLEYSRQPVNPSEIFVIRRGKSDLERIWRPDYGRAWELAFMQGEVFFDAFATKSLFLRDIFGYVPPVF